MHTSSIAIATRCAPEESPIRELSANVISRPRWRAWRYSTSPINATSAVTAPSTSMKPKAHDSARRSGACSRSDAEEISCGEMPRDLKYATACAGSPRAHVWYAAPTESNVTPCDSSVCRSTVAETTMFTPGCSPGNASSWSTTCTGIG